MPLDGIPKREKRPYRRHGATSRLPGESARARAERLDMRYSRTSLCLNKGEWARFQAYAQAQGVPAGTLLRDLAMTEVAEYEEGQE